MQHAELQKIYKQYKKKACEICGARQHYWFDKKIFERMGVVLHVHHIDRNKYNNEESNLKTLCHRCHLNLGDHKEKISNSIIKWYKTKSG